MGCDYYDIFESDIDKICSVIRFHFRSKREKKEGGEEYKVNYSYYIISSSLGIEV